MILVPVLTTLLIHFSWKGWENVLFELMSERVKKKTKGAGEKRSASLRTYHGDNDRNSREDSRSSLLVWKMRLENPCHRVPLNCWRQCCERRARALLRQNKKCREKKTVLVQKDAVDFLYRELPNKDSSRKGSKVTEITLLDAKAVEVPVKFGAKKTRNSRWYPKKKLRGSRAHPAYSVLK